MIDRDNYSKIYDNGADHIEAAKLLAGKGLFGFAISHLILGMEELIKYQVVSTHLADDSLFTNDEINSKSGSSVFRSHKTKHKLIEEFQNSLSPEFRTLFLEYVFKLASGQSLEEKHVNIKNNRFKEIGNFLGSSYNHLNLSVEEKEDFFKWLNVVKGKYLKDRGFYVNWEGKTWEFPLDLTEENYQTTLKYVTLLQQLTEVIKCMDVTDEEFIQWLNSDIT